MSSPSLTRALAAFNTGQLDEARRLLKEHLKISSSDVDAWYLLGVTEQAANHPDAALDLYDSVLTRSNEHLGAHYNKGLLLSTLGRHEEAMRHHDAAARLAPNNPWVFVNRGNSLAAMKRPQAALTDFDRALQLAPDSAAAWANKGGLLLEIRAFEQALRCLDQALKLDAGNASIWANRGGAFVKLRRFDEALRSAEHCLGIDAAHAGGWTCKATTLNQLERHDEALACADKAVQLRPQSHDAWLVRGDILTDLDRYDEGFASYDRCLELAPGHAQALINKGVVLADLGRKAEAHLCFEQVIQNAPGDADAAWNLAVLDIQRGSFGEGWARFESRWQKSDSDNRRLVTQRPCWNGSASDRTLLLWGEQGIGDQILYASVLSELTTLPQQKYVALDRRLLPLFARSMPGFEFIDLAQTSDALDFAEQLPLGSLPRHFRPSWESFASARHPFLVADPARTAALREKIARPGKRVCGVSWSSKRRSIGAHKSISLAEMLMPLAGNGLHFVNLQYGDTAAERQALQSQHGIAVQSVDEIDNFNDIDGLAALIDACDFVITTSNTTAHLAGALGKETLLLLPFGKGRLWYWSESAGHNPWYPSIQAFSQEQAGDWSGPIATIQAYLAPKT